MDLKTYYNKVREVEKTILNDFAVIVSHVTGDGGKPGTFTEVAKRVAARMVVNGIARLATVEESTVFQTAQAEALRVAEQLAAAAKLQLAVLSTEELDKLKAAAKPKTRTS